MISGRPCNISFASTFAAPQGLFPAVLSLSVSLAVAVAFYFNAPNTVSRERRTFFYETVPKLQKSGGIRPLYLDDKGVVLKMGRNVIKNYRKLVFGAMYLGFLSTGCKD